MFPNPDWWVSHPLVPRRHGPCEGIDDASLSKTCVYARANACTSSSGRQATGYTAACPCLQTAARGHLIGAPDRCESAPPRPSAKGKEREGGVHRCMQATTRCYTASANVLFPFLGGDMCRCFSVFISFLLSTQTPFVWFLVHAWSAWVFVFSRAKTWRSGFGGNGKAKKGEGGKRVMLHITRASMG